MNVNIDALIQREDFEVENTNSFSLNLQVLQIRDLEENAFVYKTLRKPDFQRETNEWTPEKVCEFIESFLAGDLIPSIILWNAGGVNFVIDGAHRLSALISWVFDDYGDGHISKSFFDHNIAKEQLIVAEKTRNKIKRTIGTYKEHQNAIIDIQNAEPELLKRAQRLATLGLQLQWVPGNAEKAEHSFFKINEQATPINDTEKELLKSRKKPNAIAARAIVRSGTGHKYWSKFSQDKMLEIEKIAEEINNLLFTPKLETPIKTMDLPLAGKGYSSKTLNLILDFVNITNNINSKSTLENDETGEGTIKVLSKSRKVLNRIIGTHPSSLGLHPVVYFYSASGRYQITAFYAVVQLFTDKLNDTSFFKNFTINRSIFESFLLKYKPFINQINFKYGSGLKSHNKVKQLFLNIIELTNNNSSLEEIAKVITTSDSFNYLNIEDTGWGAPSTNKFSKDTKSATYIRDALKNPVICEECNGLIHKNSITFDHIVRVEDGGLGNINNAQLMHPFCNSTMKN